MKDISFGLIYRLTPFELKKIHTKPHARWISIRARDLSPPTPIYVFLPNYCQFIDEFWESSLSARIAIFS